jgi:hypothetical protein
MKEPKYTTSFSSTVRPLVDEEKDKYLAMASLIDVGEFIPEVDTGKNVDLLPIAFNSFVANRVNKNDDVVDAATTLAMYKQFINKPINIEHNRDRVIGVILTAGFSEFGTDKVLTEDEVSNSDAPFNVTLGGVIWKVVNRGIAEVIEDSADPTSEMYRKISASWELGFSDYNILVMNDGEKNIANSEIITDSEKIGEMKAHLKGFGGEGKLENGKRVYRKVIGDVVPLGIGLTQSPAADVQGLAVKVKEEEIINKQEEDIPKENPASSPDNSEEKPENNISQPNKLDVTTVSANHEEHFMKIESIKDITDASLQELKATAVTDFIEEELKKASEDYSKQKAEADEALKSATEATQTLKTEHEELKDKLEKAESSLAELEKEKADREAEAVFTERMAKMDDEYVLTDADREVIASDIKEMEQEDFDKYAEKMNVLMSSKKRELVEKAQAEAKAAEEAVQEEAKHEVKAETETTEEVVEEAVNQATETEAEVPAGAVTEEQTLREKYKDAFALDQFEIKHR